MLVRMNMAHRWSRRYKNALWTWTLLTSLLWKSETSFWLPQWCASTIAFTKKKKENPNNHRMAYPDQGAMEEKKKSKKRVERKRRGATEEKQSGSAWTEVVLWESAVYIMEDPTRSWYSCRAGRWRTCDCAPALQAVHSQAPRLGWKPCGNQSSSHSGVATARGEQGDTGRRA